MEIEGSDSEATPKYRSPPYLYRSSRGGRFRFAARTTPSCLPASVHFIFRKRAVENTTKKANAREQKQEEQARENKPT